MTARKPSFAMPVLALALAMALQPATVRADARLVSRTYDENQVVRIDGKLGIQATIGFGDGERIENVAVGDAEQWQITPNKRADLLFIKPLAADARTNMTVVTDRHTYFFDLVASPTAKPIYMLRFSYGEPAPAPIATAPVVPIAATPPVAPGPAQGIPAPAAKEQRYMTRPAQAMPAPAAAVPVGDAVDPALLNFAWRVRGYEKLSPSRVYDDGAVTYLLWGEGQEVPAILVRDAKGDEVPANLSVRGNTTIIDQVPREIVLRGAKGKATLENLRELVPSTAPATPAPAVAAPSALVTAEPVKGK